MDQKQIEGALESLSKRLSVVENALNIKAKTEAVATPKEPSPTPVNTPTSHDKQMARRSWDTPPVNTAPSAGGGWMGAVAVLFFIMAASLFVKLAIDSGWLTPVRQLSGVVVFALALIVSGFRLRASDSHYAGFLPAAGIAILFLAAYSGHLYYGLYDTNVAVLAVSAVTAGAIYLFFHFRHDFFLIAAMLGSYLVPIFISSDGGFLKQEFFYYLFWNVLYCYLAVLLRKRLLIVLAAYLGLGVYQISYVTSYTSSQEFLLWAVCMQALQFAIFVAANAYYSVRNQQSLSSVEAWAFFPVLMLFYIIEYSLLESLWPELTPYLALGFATVIFVIYHFTRQRLAQTAMASAPMLSAFIAVVVLHVTYLELLPDGWGAWYGVALMAVVAILGRAKLEFSRFWICYLMIYAVIGLEYLNILEAAPLARHSEYFLLNTVYFAALLFVYLQNRATGAPMLVLAAGQLQALVGLNRLAELLAAGENQRYFTSTFWAIFALINILYAAKIKDRLLARMAVVIFGIVAVKVLFSDVGNYSGIGPIIALVTVGALLYAGGLILRKINSWT